MTDFDAPAHPDVETMIAAAERSRAPSEKLPPGEWAKKNLFNNWYNTVISVVMAAIILGVTLATLQWVFNTDFAIIRKSLRLFMVGQFPRDELTRLWVSFLLMAVTLGFTSGAAAHNTYDDAVEKDLPAERESWLDLFRRFWAIIAVHIFFVSFANTLPPYLGLAAVFATVVVTRELGWRLPRAARDRGAFVGAGLGIASMLALSGTGGLGRWAFALLFAAWASFELGRRDVRSDNLGTLIRVAVTVVAGAIAFLIVDALSIEGFGWDEWGGLHLNIFVTVVGLGLGLPFGILLAMGRRSELPIIKAASVLFIEFVRGVPLISLLLFSNLMLGLFFPLGSDLPSELTLAMIVIMGFSAAYIAEIVRGGLQSVPKGQIEAAQASGLSPGAVQRLVVLPQALRNVIPAMVGQFISLFKDTSLLSIIGVLEILNVSAVANAQTEFIGKGLAVVTYPFVALAFWAFAYTMSKESRRLETKLGVGTR
ncbi:MAG: general L-amino acid transport system permease protein [Candidatus Aldehydirespiratoraceae bacterium]|jgi:general L-amino acid transport system permease protein